MSCTAPKVDRSFTWCARAFVFRCVVHRRMIRGLFNQYSCASFARNFLLTFCCFRWWVDWLSLCRISEHNRSFVLLSNTAFGGHRTEWQYTHHTQFVVAVWCWFDDSGRDHAAAFHLTFAHVGLARGYFDHYEVHLRGH